MPTTPAQQAHYQKNKERYIAQSKEQRRAVKKIVDDIKSNPCTDCGVKYPPYVMQFDHVRGQKVANVAHLLTRNNLSAILAEIEKCDLVCANCHAERTHSRTVGEVVSQDASNVLSSVQS